MLTLFKEMLALVGIVAILTVGFAASMLANHLISEPATEAVIAGLLIYLSMFFFVVFIVLMILEKVKKSITVFEEKEKSE